MDNLKSALVATRLLVLKTHKGALKVVLDVLQTNHRLGDLQDLIDDIKGATNEIFVCQQNNERAFKPLWYRYVAKQQWIDHTPSVDNIDGIQGRLWLALDSVLDAFRVHPFALSPEKIRRANHLPIFAILNYNREAATRHQTLARQLGNAWVDDRARGYIHDSQIQDLGVLKTSLLELLWSGLIEQLKRDSPYSSDDPKQPDFERTVGELERVIQNEMVRSRQQRFTIAFCGTAQADKSSFLNALMGQSILPSDGEAHDPRIPHFFTEYHCRVTFYSFALPTSPCRWPEISSITISGRTIPRRIEEASRSSIWPEDAKLPTNAGDCVRSTTTVRPSVRRLERRNLTQDDTQPMDQPARCYPR